MIDRKVIKDDSIRTVLGVCSAILLLVGASASVSPALAVPAASDANGTVQKYQPVTEEQARFYRQCAELIAAKAKKIVTPNLHLVETPHFWIYSAWNVDNDGPLKEICENLYKALCFQFDIPSKENIWAGKCCIFIFWERTHFIKFAKEVDGAETDMSKTAAYQSGLRGGFRYIVLGSARTKSWFFEMLTHEGTHAFISRYLTNGRVPDWVNEGLAEYMANLMVPNSNSLAKMKAAVKQAKLGRDVSSVFTEVKMNSYDYGIAQSFVQFLATRNRKGFVGFIADIKMGKSEKEALKTHFGWTQQDLVMNWKAWVR